MISKSKDFEQIARQKLAPQNFGYFTSGADEQITLKNNSAAFRSIKLYPRVLRRVSLISTSTQILGQKVSLPFGVAPFAMQKLIRDKDDHSTENKGELISAFEAGHQNTAYGLSMMSNSSIRDVSSVNPEGLKIMQLYFLKNAAYTTQIIREAESNGFSALAITIDTQSFGKRRTDERNKFSPEPTLKVFEDLSIPLKFRDDENREQSFIHSIENNISFDLVERIKKLTHLKVILKGVVNSEDIEKCYQAGVDAVWISNHGGRQLDTAPATIWVLQEIREKINSLSQKFGRRMELFIDGGVWKGSDIFKCLALGADFVFIGRAFLYSLIQKQAGIKACFEMLTKELKTTMALAGATSINEINSSYIFDSSRQFPFSRL